MLRPRPTSFTTTSTTPWWSTTRPTWSRSPIRVDRLRLSPPLRRWQRSPLRQVLRNPHSPDHLKRPRPSHRRLRPWFPQVSPEALSSERHCWHLRCRPPWQKKNLRFKRRTLQQPMGNPRGQCQHSRPRARHLPLNQKRRTRRPVCRPQRQSLRSRTLRQEHRCLARAVRRRRRSMENPRLRLRRLVHQHQDRLCLALPVSPCRRSMENLRQRVLLLVHQHQDEICLVPVSPFPRSLENRRRVRRQYHHRLDRLCPALAASRCPSSMENPRQRLRPLVHRPDRLSLAQAVSHYRRSMESQLGQIRRQLHHQLQRQRQLSPTTSHRDRLCLAPVSPYHRSLASLQTHHSPLKLHPRRRPASPASLPS